MCRRFLGPLARRATGLLLCVASVWLSTAPARAELQVVVTIKPIHALAAQVMAGVGTPRLLVDGASSPHSYSLKPSDVRLLNAADVVIRVSELLEPFTARALRALPARIEVVTLEAAPGLTLLARRAGGTFETDAHDHDKAKGHRDHRPKAKTVAQPAVDQDPHIWLDPGNARIIVDRIAAVLSARAPADAFKFAANAAAAKGRIDALETELARDLAPLAGRPFVVFHDAYQYFEARFGLAAAGSITVSPEISPGAKRLAELRRKIAATNAACVFSEPQFEAKVIGAVTEGSSARTAMLDPEGVLLAPGPDLYDSLMRGLARGFVGCLAAP